MMKSNLRTGMKVVLRNGQSRFVVLGMTDPETGAKVDALVCCSATNWGDLSKYNSDLTRSLGKGNLDVMEVFQPSSPYNICCPSFTDYTSIWKRNEYARDQAAAGFKVGQYVIVNRGADAGELGWNPVKVGRVNPKVIGEVVKIISICASYIEVATRGGLIYLVPYFVLAHYTPETITVGGKTFREELTW
jgi:hypothetical protein